MREMIKCMEDSVMEQALHGLLSLNPDISSEIMSTVMKQKPEDESVDKKMSQKSDSPPLDLSPPSALRSSPSLSNDSLMNSLSKSNLPTPSGSVNHSPIQSPMLSTRTPPTVPANLVHPSPFTNPMFLSLNQEIITSAMYYGAPPLFSQQGYTSPINLVKSERKSLDDKSPARDNEKNLLSPSHRHSVNTMNLSRSRSSIDSMSAMSHQSSYDNEDLDSLDAISRRTSYDFSDEEIQALNYRHLQNQMNFENPNFAQMNMRNKMSTTTNPIKKRPFKVSHTTATEDDRHPPSLESASHSRPSSVSSQHNSPFPRNEIITKTLQSPLLMNSPSPYQMTQSHPMTSPPLFNSRVNTPKQSISETGGPEKSIYRQERSMIRQSPVDHTDSQEDRRKFIKLSSDSSTKTNKPRETAIVCPTVKIEDENQLSVAFLTYKVHQSFQTNFRSRADLRAMEEKIIEFKQRSMLTKQDVQLLFQVG